MTDLLRTAKDSFQHTIDAAKEVSTRGPGILVTQVLVVGVLVGVVAHRLMKKRYRLPPGPRPLPLLGNLLSIRSKNEQFYAKLDRWAKESYGPVMSIYFGPMLCVFLNDLDTINEAFIQRGSDFAGRPRLHSMGLLSEGFKDIAFADYSPVWKLQRKIAIKALRQYMTGSHLEKVVHESMAKVTDKMAAEPGPFDPHPYNSMLMFHILDRICFGNNKRYNNSSIQRVTQIFEKLVKEMGTVFLEDIVPLLKYWPTKKLGKLAVLADGIKDYIEENVEEHRRNFSHDNVCDVTDNILLAQMEAAQEEKAEVMAMFTDVHIRQTISDLYQAGSDTSRYTLDWAMLFIAGHPEIQKRAQAEIDAATGTDMPRVEHRSKLQYTQAVLYEIMRLGVVVPLALAHKTLCDTTVGGYDVPKNTMVMANIWAVGRDPDLWDQPEEFRPERFLDDQGSLKPTPKGWLPFSAGRRVCLGESVSKPELLLLLACFLKRFTISLPEGMTYDPRSQIISMNNHTPKPFQIVVTQR